MEKKFRSSREIFRHYLPEQFEQDKITEMSFSEQIPHRTDKLVEKFLENFRLSLGGLFFISWV